VDRKDKNKEIIDSKSKWQTVKGIKVKVKIKTKVPAHAMTAHRGSSHS